MSKRHEAIIAAGILVASCAPKQTPFMDYVYEYPRLESERCDGRTASTHIRVVAKDAAGAALGRAVVYLLPAEGAVGTTQVAAKTTNEAGIATFEAASGQAYAVTVMMRGFHPVSRVALAAPGCRGVLHVQLKVAEPN